MQYRYVVDYIPTIYYLIQRGANIKDPNLHSLLQKQQKTQVAKDNVERITQIINAQHKKYEEFKKFVRKHTKEQCKALAKGEKEDIIREGLLAKILTEKTTKKFRIANMDETQPLPALLAKKLNDIAQQEIQKILEHYNKENSIFSRVLTKILNLLAKLSISLAEKLKDTKLAIFALGNPEIKHKLQKIGEEVQVGITSYSFQDKHQSSQQKHQDRLLSQRRSSCEGPSI